MLAIRFDYTPTNALNETSEIVLSADNIGDIFEHDFEDCVCDCALPMVMMYTVQIDHFSESTSTVAVEAALCSMRLGSCVAFDALIKDKTIYTRRFRNIDNLCIKIDNGDNDSDNRFPYSIKFLDNQGDMVLNGNNEPMRFTNLFGPCHVWHYKSGYGVSAWFDEDIERCPAVDSDDANDTVQSIVICSFLYV